MTEPRRNPGKYLDGTIAVFLFALLCFLPPLVNFWGHTGQVWYFPYLIWGFVVVLIFAIQKLRSQKDV